MSEIIFPGYENIKLRFDTETRYTIMSLPSGQKDIIGLVLPPELIELNRLVKTLPSDAAIMEVGSCMGLSSGAMALGCLGTKRRLYVLDTFPLGNLAKFDRGMKSLKVNPHIVMYRGDSRSMPIQYPPEKIDMLFIDGDHSIETVKSDSDNFFSCLKSGGILALHDHGNQFDGPRMAWDKLIAESKVKLLNKVLSLIVGIKQ